MSHDPSRADDDRADDDRADDDRADERGPFGVLARLLASFRGGEARPAADALLRVASSRLAGTLGGAAHLAHLFANPAWAPLLGHRAARVDGLERIGDAARARIEVEASDGVRVAYLASLRRGPDDGPDDEPDDEPDPAWRLTGLVREELADL